MAVITLEHEKDGAMEKILGPVEVDDAVLYTTLNHVLAMLGQNMYKVRADDDGVVWYDFIFLNAAEVEVNGLMAYIVPFSRPLKQGDQ